MSKLNSRVSCYALVRRVVVLVASVKLAEGGAKMLICAEYKCFSRVLNFRNGMNHLIMIRCHTEGVIPY